METEEGKKFLESRSPLTQVDKIKRPLLIGQGANDPRVKQAESDQIVKATRPADPVTYGLLPDEGHWTERPENFLAVYVVTEASWPGWGAAATSRTATPSRIHPERAWEAPTWYRAWGKPRRSRHRSRVAGRWARIKSTAYEASILTGLSRPLLTLPAATRYAILPTPVGRVEPPRRDRPALAADTLPR